MTKWLVKMTRKSENELKSHLKSGVITKIDINVIKVWLTEMEQKGPEFITKSRRWTDHPLHSEWDGFRASCYSALGRIIYKIDGLEITVEVHRVTPAHDYKK